jgi:regulator of protease activity HflC (stomatin/prohibitin superfamily)
MFGIRYIKVPPTTYLIHYRKGQVHREGPGLSFFYFAPASTLVAVPLGSTDAPFVFNEVTADFQAITLQGQLTYRVSDPKRLAQLLNFTIRSGGDYISEDPETFPQRLLHAAQVLTRSAVQRMALREALALNDTVVSEILASLRRSETVAMLGVEVLGLSFLSVRPTPETAKALEAEAREALQRRADEAIYARRNAAVEQERRIKENELNTEIAVEEIFSDGIEEDYVAFNAGAIARIHAADRKARLVMR